MKRGRRGFTLIETLITLTLATFLLVIVWTMLDIYTKLEDKGVRASQQAAVVRAAQRQLRHDLMQLATVDPARPSPIQQNAAAQSVYPSNGYLFGSATELHFVTVNGDGQETLRVVSYSSRIPQSGEQSDSPPDGDRLDEPSPGVVRVERSWPAFQSDRLVESNDFSMFTAGREINLQQDDFLSIGVDQSDRSGQDSFSAAPEVHDEIPEIAGWNFRYFDNGGWHDQWDSGWHRRPPMAIEVRFDLNNGKSEIDEAEDRFATSIEESASEYRFVISLGINSSFSIRKVQQ